MAKQAIGILETKGLVSLLEASDAALKAADIKMTGWEKIGSGLVTGFFTGDVAAVKAGLDAAAAAASSLGKSPPSKSSRARTTTCRSSARGWADRIVMFRLQSALISESQHLPP